MVANPRTRGAMHEYVIPGALLDKIQNNTDICLPMTAMFVNTGRVLPHEIALRPAHLLYIFLGVLARNLYIKVKMINPTTCDNTPAAIVKP